MRSKAPLMLMEQMIMLLVFALASALCLQAFVKADVISKESEARDHAVLLCQSVAEQIKESGEKDRNPVGAVASRLNAADRTPNSFALFYDKDWNRIDTVETATYMLSAVTLESDVPGMETAGVYVQKTDRGTNLFFLEVAWQGVIAHA